MVTPEEGLSRLRSAEASGELARWCRRAGIELLTVFGSLARGDDSPRDVDVAVLPAPRSPFDLLTVIADLVDLAGLEQIDVVDLSAAGPVLRERALVGGIVLHEEHQGLWARASTAAVMERMDTDWLRRLDLDLLAG